MSMRICVVCTVLRVVASQAAAQRSGRLFDDNDIVSSKRKSKRKQFPIVKRFLVSKLNSSEGRNTNNYTVHHDLVTQHCKLQKEGCNWKEYYAVLDELRKPFRDWKDPGALPMQLENWWQEPMTSCDRLHKPTRKEFLDQVISRRPAIITGVLDKWKAIKKWTWKYLLDHLADHKVKLSVNPTEFFDGPELASLWNLSSHEYVITRPGMLDVKFQEFYGLLKSRYAQEAYYYLQYFPISSLRGLGNDLGDLTFADWLQTRFYLIWFGDGRTGGHLHYDVQENLMAIIRGGKTFLLFDPSQSNDLYANLDMPEVHLMYGFDKEQQHHFLRDKSTISLIGKDIHNHYSPVNPDKPDYKRWPRTKKAKPVICKVEAGEVLYNPSHWWHHVKSHPDKEGKSIGVNIFAEGLYNRYNALDPFFVSNRFYSHIHSFQDPRPGHSPSVRAHVNGDRVEFQSRHDEKKPVPSLEL